MGINEKFLNTGWLDGEHSLASIVLVSNDNSLTLNNNDFYRINLLIMIRFRFLFDLNKA